MGFLMDFYGFGEGLPVGTWVRTKHRRLLGRIIERTFDCGCFCVFWKYQIKWQHYDKYTWEMEMDLEVVPEYEVTAELL